MSYEDLHDEILEEERDSIIGSLEAAKVIQITKTEHGYQFVELCDGYYGTSLSQEQMERFIGELQALAGLK